MLRRAFLKSLFGAAVAVPAGAGARPEAAPRRPLVLQRSPLAGFQFHDGEAVWASLSPGDPLDLAREPGNPHDERAVAVHWRGHKLGYVPRTDNCAPAQLLDRGRPVAARILHLTNAGDPWQRVSLELFLPAT